MGKALEAWEKVNTALTLKKGKTTERGQPHLIFCEFCKTSPSRICLQPHEGQESNWEGQHGFIQDKSYLTDAFVFYNEMTAYVKKGEMLDSVYLSFS